MKIKRLTAGLAVAAMAATFFAAAPIVSANAFNYYTNPTYADAGTVAYTGDIFGTNSTTLPVYSIDVMQVLADSHINLAWIDTASGNTTADAWHMYYDDSYKAFISSYPCDTVSVIEDNQGTATCDPRTGNVLYSPAIANGMNGDLTVSISFRLKGTVVPTLDFSQAPYNTMYDGEFIDGVLTLIVQHEQVTGGCPTGHRAECLSATLQAWGKGDKQTTATVTTIAPNIHVNATAKTPESGFLTPAQGSTWQLVGVNNPTSIDALSLDAMNSYVVQGTAKDPNAIVFSAPKNWSGTITYQYKIALVINGIADTKNSANYATGSVTFTVQPTLPAIDDLSTDPGVAVTIPVLDQTIIGTPPFQDASCVFASGKNKTSQTGVGTIVNKGGSKNPVFTPADGFVGDVTLSCTVADKWDPISNAVSVVVHVGAPAPAPVAPATTPACDNCGNGGKLVSTGGSLAAPMSSGLAAVVLLVAAGAGILVVRRRTALAG